MCQVGVLHRMEFVFNPTNCTPASMNAVPAIAIRCSPAYRRSKNANAANPNKTSAKVNFAA